MGERVKDEYGIVATASKEKLPVFCPALADSSIGMAFTVYRNERKKKNQAPMIYDALLDNLEIMSLKRRWTKSGVILLGGGTPKYYIQQVIPCCGIAGLTAPTHSFTVHC